MAVLAVQKLHGMANVVHMGGHAHEGEAGRAKERLRVLQRAVGEAHSVSLGEQPAVGWRLRASRSAPHETGERKRGSAQARRSLLAKADAHPNIVFAILVSPLGLFCLVSFHPSDLDR